MGPEAEELPPATVMCTSTAAVISAVPSIVPFVLGAVWLPVVALGFLVAPSLDGLRLTAASALGVAIPVLQVIALTRFFRRRRRGRSLVTTTRPSPGLGTTTGCASSRPYAARMHPTAQAVRRRPPAAAVVAAVLGLVSCAFPALLVLVVLALAGPGGLEDAAWVDYALPLLLMCGLVAGAVLLLLGRSWLTLVVAAAVLIALMVAARVLGGWGGGPIWLLGWVAPGLTVVLSALPGVRGWVAARRAERAR